CLKCLGKQRGKRYRTASALAAELRRFQAGEPILARPVSRWEKTIKWAKRHPARAALAGVSGLAAVAVVVMGVALVAYNQLQGAYTNATHQRELAEQAAAEAVKQRTLAEGAKEEALEQRGLAVRA